MNLKNQISLLFFCFLATMFIFNKYEAQNNSTINYQAVAHTNNGTGETINNTSIDVEISILSDTTMSPVFIETHNVTTNSYGLFSLQIGSINTLDFEDIEWGDENFYLGVSIDGELMGYQLLVSVPYSLSSLEAQKVNGNTVESSVPANAIFTDNQTISIDSDSLYIENGNAISLNNLSSADDDWTFVNNNLYNTLLDGKVAIGDSVMNIGKLNITTDANTTRGIYILNNTSANNSTQGKFGVYASVSGDGTGDNQGAWFDATGQGTGVNYGVAGYASGSAGENRGVYGAAASGTSNWAGYFDSGDVKIKNKLLVGEITPNGPTGGFQLIDGNQGAGRILKSDAQGNAQWVQIGSLGVGVMLKNAYDSNNNSIVDNAELVNGFQVGTNVPANSIFTDNQNLTLTSDSLIISNGSGIALDSLNFTNLSINDLSNGYEDSENNLFLVAQPNSLSTAKKNIAIGANALATNTSSESNIAIGYYALNQSTVDAQIAIGTNALSNNTTGLRNNALGHSTLSNNTTGSMNNAFGYGSLLQNTTGNANTAIGQWTLLENTTGYGNTAVGKAALYNNTSGNTNTAIGVNAMFENISGGYNTAVGEVALKNNTIGNGNVGIGHKTLETNTNGNFNVALGSYALQQSTNSSSNVAVGERALDNNTTGQENVAIGRHGLTNNTIGNNNTALGFNANVGSNNLSNSTAIGANATVSISDAMVLGNNVSVGIATSSPTEKLDVNGQIRMRAGASNGYIPVSDNNGVMTWTSPDSMNVNMDINDLHDGYTDQINNLNISSNVSNNMNSGSYNNVAIGQGSLDNNSGNDNIALGVSSLTQNTTGNINVAIGTRALNSNQTGYGNTAIGYQTLEMNTTGSENTAIGQNSLPSNTTGGQNTALGSGALISNTIGNANVAIGLNSSYKNIDGAGNTAVGYGALFENINGSSNATLGENSLQNNLGSQNTAIGNIAGSNQTNGNQNTFIGYNTNILTGANLVNNSTAIGANAIVSQSNSVILGNNADVGVGISSPGINSGAKRYVTISSGDNNPSIIDGTSLELKGGSSSSDGLQNRIDFIARSTSGTELTTGRIEMVNGTNTSRGTMNLYTGGQSYPLTERITILENGKVGIGTITPSEKLEVSGNTKIHGDLILQSLSGTGDRSIVVDPSGKIKVNPSNTTVGFLTGMSTSSDQNFGSGGSGMIVILKNGSTAFNDGGGYNANNGRFTAPVDGIYQFNVNLSIQITNPNEGLLQMILDSPGAKYGESVILTTQDNSSGYGYYQISIAQTVKLSANSQIWVTIFSSQNNGKIDMWSSSFSGHLVK